MRCFIGCSVSPSDRAALAALIQARAGAGWRLIPPANYHVTLCFLGDQLPAALAAAMRWRSRPSPRPRRHFWRWSSCRMQRCWLCTPRWRVAWRQPESPLRQRGFAPISPSPAAPESSAPRRWNSICRSTNSVCSRVSRHRMAPSTRGSTALRSAPMALPRNAGGIAKPEVTWP